MKKLLKRFLFASFVIAGIVSCSTSSVHISPHGAITSKDRNVTKHYDKIVIESGIELFLTQDSVAQVKIETYSNVHEFVEVIQNNNSLLIRVVRGTEFNGNPRIRAFVSMSDLSTLSLSGGAGASLNNSFKLHKLELSISGGGRMTGRIAANASVMAVISGGSELSLLGTSPVYNLECSGGSRAYDFGFVCGIVNVALSGGSTASISALDAISIEASGGSTLKYMGDAIIKSVSTSGGSNIIKEPGIPVVGLKM